jgi:succinate dehydrogenase / fumarate reductase, cytochrome b subunit
MNNVKTSRMRDRPLSPHLQIYKPMLTMMMSIVHRITGSALYLGTLLLIWWLIAAAAGPNAYAMVQWFMETLLGRFILFGYTWALIHHALGGIRHLIWDLGHGFGPAEREWLTVATLVGSVGLTIVIWFVGYLVMGGIRGANTSLAAFARRSPASVISARRNPAPATSGTSGLPRLRLSRSRLP